MEHLSHNAELTPQQAYQRLEVIKQQKETVLDQIFGNVVRLMVKSQELTPQQFVESEIYPRQAAADVLVDANTQKIYVKMMKAAMQKVQLNFSEWDLQNPNKSAATFSSFFPRLANEVNDPTVQVKVIHAAGYPLIMHLLKELSPEEIDQI